MLPWLWEDNVQGAAAVVMVQTEEQVSEGSSQHTDGLSDKDRDLARVAGTLCSSYYGIMFWGFFFIMELG